MKFALTALSVALFAAPAMAQQFAANNGYKVCPTDVTAQGVSVVTNTCGSIDRPDFSAAQFGSLAELEAARIQRETFTEDVTAYGQCVTQFINSYRRPGADANSTAPDQAACAHSWAEDQATQTVREYGKACVDFSNRSMMDASIEPWSGECYPDLGNGRG